MVNETMMAKLIGAILGSSIAIVYVKDCTPTSLLIRFVIGVICGFIAAPIIIDYLKWEHSFDYWLAASTLGGVGSYFTLHHVFSGTFMHKFTQSSK